VNAHAQPQFRVLLQRAANLQRAFNRRFQTMVKDQRHAIADRDFDQPACRFSGLEFIRATNDLV
jgi:hypothetical protein